MKNKFTDVEITEVEFRRRLLDETTKQTKFLKRIKNIVLGVVLFFVIQNVGRSIEKYMGPQRYPARTLYDFSVE